MISKSQDSKTGEEKDPEIVNDVIAPPPSYKPPMHPILWQLMIISGVVMYGSYTILVHLCEVDGHIPFSPASAYVIIESSKLAMAISMYVPEVKKFGPPRLRLNFVLPFAVPAVLYTINNNLAVQMQLQMDPATYQVLANLKILSTAFLYRLIIKRPITGKQWIALCLLVAAGASNSYGGMVASGGDMSPGVVHISLTGLVMIFIYCTISGTAGVYTEYILKDKYEVSLHLQNTLLYTFGVCLNGMTWVGGVMFDGEAGSFDPFQGYSVYTWLLIVTQALVGLIMSAIFKYGSNILRLFVISCAMLVTTIMSMIIFKLQINLYFAIAFTLVVVALGLNNSK